MADLRFFQFFIKVRHHPEDVLFSHDFVDPAIGARTLRRAAGWCVNHSSHPNILREFAYRFDFSKSISRISRGREHEDKSVCGSIGVTTGNILDASKRRADGGGD